jgi:hypothetical protein
LAKFKALVPKVDIVVDDGSHLPEHQIVTLEEMLPHVSAEGVYLCEDIENGTGHIRSWHFYCPWLMS